MSPEKLAMRATTNGTSRGLTGSCLALGCLLLVASCTFLSDKQYVQQNPQYQGVRRVVVFLQRWPVYQQLAGQHRLEDDFIKGTTPFLGPWEPASNLNTRALDLRDIDDDLMGEVILGALQKKGYQPFKAEVWPTSPSRTTVATMMAQYQALSPDVDGFLFCFYAPTLYLSHPPTTPVANGNRSPSLAEVMQVLGPGSLGVVWAGPRAGLAPNNSISHAFIYISMTMFKPRTWQPLWEVAASQAGGAKRPWIPECPPGPTDQDYWADAGIIRNLMIDNLECRLRHLIPNAF